MNPVQLMSLLGSAAVGAVMARLLTPTVIARAPQGSLRMNVSGRAVPAVLGFPLVVGGLVPVAAWVGVIAGARGALAPVVTATGLVLLAFAAAGRWDDTKGHELPRGFKGHLGAARSGRLTGGLIKLLAGGAVGLAAGILLRDGQAAVQTFLIVPLTANLLNLLDRAPGRAGKAGLLLGIPLLALGHTGWSLAAAGVLGATAYLLVVDLAEIGMLGDMGANSLGGVLGLGLALSVPLAGRWFVIAALLALNLLSERFSFSRGIARVGVLNRLDLWGRRRDDENANTSGP